MVREAFISPWPPNPTHHNIAHRSTPHENDTGINLETESDESMGAPPGEPGGSKA